MRSELPDNEYLHECFIYDEASGDLVWKTRPLHHHVLTREVKRFNTKYAGMMAGRIKRDGYREVVLDKRYYSAHRIIYKMMTGNDPEDCVDHINGVKSDNRWCNLRCASTTENNHNRRISRNNTSGHKGVSCLKDGRYKASIRVGGGKRLHLGYFDNVEDAAIAYATAAEEHHGEFSCY